MLSFTLTKSKKNLEEQWTNLYRIGQDKDWETLLFRFLPLLSGTALYGLFYWITPTNDFVNFKVVTISVIAIAWTASLVFISIHFIIEKKRSKRHFKELMEMIPDSGLSYAVRITEEKVILVSWDETHEFPGRYLLLLAFTRKQSMFLIP